MATYVHISMYIAFIANKITHNYLCTHTIYPRLLYLQRLNYQFTLNFMSLCIPLVGLSVAGVCVII